MRLARPYPKTLRRQIQLLVVGLLLLLLITGIASAIVQTQIDKSRTRLLTVLRPAQVAAAELTENYIDQAIAEREYLITGNPTQLLPYITAQHIVAQERAQLGQLVGDDREVASRLRSLDRAAAEWDNTTADPEIAQRRSGVITDPDVAIQEHAGTDERLLNNLRTAASAVEDRVAQLLAAQSQAGESIQTVANQIAIGATVAAVLLTVIALVVLRESLAQPLIQLVSQVRRAAGGDLERSVRISRPADLAMVGDAVETMRTRILAETARAAEAGKRVARYAEAERIARDLNETVVQQLFRTALDLQSAASRQPAAARALETAVQNIDDAIRDLQTAIFGLTLPPEQPDGLSKRVLDVVGESEARLGFSPQVRFDGQLDNGLRQPVADELVGALHRILTGLAAHDGPRGVQIDLGQADGRLRLRITADVSETDTDHVGPFGPLAELTERARLLGASCTWRREPAGDVLEWTAPAAEDLINQ